MIKHYNGRLGTFDYDDEEFKIKNGCIHYIGNESDGNKIKIPEGIKNCSFMFHGCEFLVNAPVIPDGVMYCNFMFKGCSSLVNPPIIPKSVLNCGHMFKDCVSLKAYVLPPAGVKWFEMYKNCPPLIQEMDRFVHRFKKY